MTDLYSDEMMSETEFFKHFGKKGMKWGVRKSDPPKNVHVSADAARVNKIQNRAKKNGFDNLSNDDIAKLNKRSQLISEYKKNNPSVVERGQKKVKQALSVAATAGAVVTLGVKVSKSPIARRGAQIIAETLRNMAASGAAGPANGGTYVQVFKALT